MESPNYEQLFEAYSRNDDPGDNATLRFISFYADVPFDDFVALYREHESLPGIQESVAASGGSIAELRAATPTMTKYVFHGQARAPKVTKPAEPMRTVKIFIDPNDMQKTERALRAVPEKSVKYDPDLHALWRLAKCGMLTLSDELREMRLRAFNSTDDRSKTAQKKLNKLKRRCGMS